MSDLKGSQISGGPLLNRMVVILYGLLMLLILILCLFYNDYFAYACHIETALTDTFPESLVMIAALAAVFLLSIFIVSCLSFIWRKKQKNPLRSQSVIQFIMTIDPIWFVSFLFLLFQIYLVSCYYFETGWDVEVILNIAEQIADGEPAGYSEYFSQFPNNLFFLYIYSSIMHLANVFHVDAYFSLLFVQCVISWLTGVTLYFTVKKIVGRGFSHLSGQDFSVVSGKEALIECWAGVIAWILYILMVGLSPWVSITYTDSASLLFPSLMVYLYLIAEESIGRIKYILYLLLGAAAYTGYKIKPQTLIVFIAIIVIEGALFLINFLRTKRASIKNFKKAAWCALGILTAWIIVAVCINSIDIETDSNRRMGITHLLMMGMNDEENGIWNQEDVTYSGSFTTTSERDSANIKEAARRVKEMGAAGLADLMARKILTNYNDGTFAWGFEGSFYVEQYSTNDSQFAKFVRACYYKWDGELYDVWHIITLGLWMAIMMLSLIGACSCYRDTDKGISVVMLALIGIAVFECLFEARARYIYIYVPLYIILAIIGLVRIQIKLYCLIRHGRLTCHFQEE